MNVHFLGYVYLQSTHTQKSISGTLEITQPWPCCDEGDNMTFPMARMSNARIYGSNCCDSMPVTWMDPSSGTTMTHVGGPRFITSTALVLGL